MEAGGVPVTGDDTWRDPRWSWPGCRPDAVVELRVHGVGGEGPDGMTRDEHPVRVSGPGDVEFWRARNPTVVDRGATDRSGRSGSTPVRQRIREVVSWGGSTSGRRRSALWVLLLPFALFNAAGRMAPGGATAAEQERHAAVCRLLALSMTLAVVATATGIALDLLAVQCAASTVCTDAPLTGRWLLAPLRWSAGDAAALLATLALVPVAVPYGLRLAGRRQLARRPPLTDPGPDHHRGRGARRLDDPDVWHNLWPTWRLRGIHVTAGYAWVLMVLGWMLPTALPGADGLLGAAGPLGVVALVASAVLVALPRVAGSAASGGFAAAMLGLRWVVLVPLGLVVGVGLSARVDLVGRGLLGAVLPVLGIVAVAWATGETVSHARRVRATSLRPRADEHADDHAARPAGHVDEHTGDHADDHAGCGGPGAADPAGGVSGAVPAPDVPADLDVTTVPDDDADVVGDGSGGAGRGAGSGPSGSVRDVALLAGSTVVGLASWLDGAVRLGPGELAAALEPAGPVFAPLVGGAIAPVYVPVWWLVVVQAVLLIALVATSGGTGTTRTSRGAAPLPLAVVPGNLTAPVVGLVALLMVAAPGAGLHAFVLDWLGTRSAAVTVTASSTPGPATVDVAAVVARGEDPRAALELVMPWWYGLTAVVTLGTTALLGAVALTMRTWLGRRHRPDATVVRGALRRSLAGLPDPATLDPARRLTLEEVVRRTADAWVAQALVRRAPAALAAVVLVVAVTVAGLVVDRGVAGVAATELPGTTLALAVLAALPPGVVLLLRAAREDRLVRRQLGTLWDVLCFWPRVTHPFSPPSYGEALVPQLVERINRYPEQTSVVLAGHSQGSVIALAAVVHPRLAPRRLHLVTYGSPVSLLYEGVHPTVFGGDDGAIACATPTGAPTDVLRTWHNVLTPTEPISTPLWGWSDPGPAAPGDGRGWPVVLRLPWSSCPACGWRRPDRPAPPSSSAPTAPTGPQAIDVTVTDPDRVLSPSWELDGWPAGHSSYHRSRELDLHLQHLT